MASTNCACAAEGKKASVSGLPAMARYGLAANRMGARRPASSQRLRKGGKSDISRRHAMLER